MLSRHQDPIIAIATAPGRGAVGIVRVSGPQLKVWADALCGKALKARQAHYLPFNDSKGEPIDQGLAIFFPGPHSYTGEDVLELQAHGGPVVLQLLLSRCLEAASQINTNTGAAFLSGLRLAAPGEFTQRAFLNDKIDLAQAEAIADLIDASTGAAARSASRSLAGDFSKEIHVLRDGLIHLRMLVEATLDFPEEEIDFLQKADAQGQLDRLQAQLIKVLARTQQGALLREGIKVVIAGQPNAGKSSLLNALAGAELAIVTPIAGTTRDVIEETLNIDGILFRLIDTAGIRETTETIEALGIERSQQKIEQATIVLCMADATVETSTTEVRAWKSQLENQFPEKKIEFILNKVDAISEVPAEGLAVSAKNGSGIEALKKHLVDLVIGTFDLQNDIIVANARHHEALQKTALALEQALQGLENGTTGDFVAMDIREAMRQLGNITGQIDIDTDILGAIFSKFCIGK